MRAEGVRASEREAFQRRSRKRDVAFLLVAFFTKGPKTCTRVADFSRAANGGFGSRPCENVREQRRCRIIFSIAVFGQPSPAFLVSRLTKSRGTFYAQIGRGSFHTASGTFTRSRRLG